MVVLRASIHPRGDGSLLAASNAFIRILIQEFIPLARSAARPRLIRFLFGDLPLPVICKQPRNPLRFLLHMYRELLRVVGLSCAGKIQGLLRVLLKCISMTTWTTINLRIFVIFYIFLVYFIFFNINFYILHVIFFIFYIFNFFFLRKIEHVEIYSLRTR